MDPSTSRSRFKHPSGLRAGIVIALALALVGVGVGTVTGAVVTQFQKVVIVNDVASPVPVDITNSSLQISAVKLDPTGNTVKIDSSANTVSLGTTDSGHLANIDTATGKLNFDGNGNLKTASTPAAPAIATKFVDDFLVAGGNETYTLSLGGTINATSIVIYTIGDVNGVFFVFNGTDRLTLFSQPGGNVVVPLPMAIPIDSVRLLCVPGICEAWVSIAGF
jgi:hypothetical protein